MTLALHHIGITTPDLARLEAFYVSHFSATVLRRHSWEAGDPEFNARIGLADSAGELVMLACAGLRLELFQFAMPVLSRPAPSGIAAPGMTHLAFATEDIDADYDRLVRLGMAFNAPPLRMPTGGIFTYGRDPDGNLVELIQPPG